VDDLARQSEFLRFHYPNHELVSDVGSGINWYRKGFKAILESVLQGTVSEIVVTDIDRLARFSTDLLRQLFKLCGCKLVVHNEKDRDNIGFEEQLVFDVLHILHVYTCKINGRRKRTIKTSSKN
jgi:predicted site-specific integrase-resolvase